MNDVTNSNIIIYHGGCPDGIVGAWCFWSVYKDLYTYFPARYNQQPPNVTGKNVIMVDFAYPLNITQQIIADAKTVTILDHHKTTNSLISLKNDLNRDVYSLILDMSRSGAQIAWDYVNPNIQRPWFIDDIGDRDLWLWKIDGSRATTRAMCGLQLYENFDSINSILDNNRDFYLTIGNILLGSDTNQYKNICKTAIDCIVSTIDQKQQYKCRVVECDIGSASDVGNILIQDDKCDFSVMWRYILDRNEWKLSCRSKSLDLTKVIPLIFGNGGGHPCATGCVIIGNKGETLRTYFKPVKKNERFNQFNIIQST